MDSVPTEKLVSEPILYQPEPCTVDDIANWTHCNTSNTSVSQSSRTSLRKTPERPSWSPSWNSSGREMKQKEDMLLYRVPEMRSQSREKQTESSNSRTSLKRPDITTGKIDQTEGKSLPAHMEPLLGGSAEAVSDNGLPHEETVRGPNQLPSTNAAKHHRVDNEHRQSSVSSKVEHQEDSDRHREDKTVCNSSEPCLGEPKQASNVDQNSQPGEIKNLTSFGTSFSHYLNGINEQTLFSFSKQNLIENYQVPTNTADVSSTFDPFLVADNVDNNSETNNNIDGPGSRSSNNLCFRSRDISSDGGVSSSSVAAEEVSNLTNSVDSIRDREGSRSEILSLATTSPNVVQLVGSDHSQAALQSLGLLSAQSFGHLAQMLQFFYRNLVNVNKNNLPQLNQLSNNNVGSSSSLSPGSLSSFQSCTQDTCNDLSNVPSAYDTAPVSSTAPDEIAHTAAPSPSRQSSASSSSLCKCLSASLTEIGVSTAHHFQRFTRRIRVKFDQQIRRATFNDKMSFVVVFVLAFLATIYHSFYLVTHYSEISEQYQQHETDDTELAVSSYLPNLSWRNLLCRVPTVCCYRTN